METFAPKAPRTKCIERPAAGRRSGQQAWTPEVRLAAALWPTLCPRARRRPRRRSSRPSRTWRKCCCSCRHSPMIERVRLPEGGTDIILGMSVTPQNYSAVVARRPMRNFPRSIHSPWRTNGGGGFHARPRTSPKAVGELWRARAREEKSNDREGCVGSAA